MVIIGGDSTSLNEIKFLGFFFNNSAFLRTISTSFIHSSIFKHGYKTHPPYTPSLALSKGVSH
jgi:hypothetical protein